MLKFRACVGPSTNRCHIRCEGETLTLCQRTVPARDVSGIVDHYLMCIPCIRAMARKLMEPGNRLEAIDSDADITQYLARQIGLDAIT